jgi:hypothetical protein
MRVDTPSNSCMKEPRRASLLETIASPLYYSVDRELGP